MNADIDLVRSYLNNLQLEITQGIQAADGEAEFVTDDWVRETGGGGRTSLSQAAPQDACAPSPHHACHSVRRRTRGRFRSRPRGGPGREKAGPGGLAGKGAPASREKLRASRE